MALKPDREYNEVTDITNFWVSTTTSGYATTGEKGGLASVVTAGSGAALGINYADDPNVVSYADSASGAIVKGVLLQDVNARMSTARDFPDYESLEIRPGDKCTLVSRGWLVTNIISGTPAVGGVAYLGPSGYFKTTQDTSAPKVGRFETTKDANGYARVFVDVSVANV